MEVKKSLIIHLVKTTKWQWIQVFGFLMQAVMFLAFISLFIYITRLAFDSGVIFGGIFSMVLLFILYIFKRFIELIFFWEKIRIHSSYLTILILTPLSIKRKKIALKDIEYFGLVTNDHYNDSHSPFIETTIVDQTGLSTYRKRRNLVKDGQIEIRTAAEIVRFGKNVASWDVDSVVRQIEIHTDMHFKK